MQPHSNIIIWACIVVSFCSFLCWLSGFLVWVDILQTWFLRKTQLGQVCVYWYRKAKIEPVNLLVELYLAISRDRRD